MELLIFALLAIVVIVAGAGYLQWTERWITKAINDEEQRLIQSQATRSNHNEPA